MDCFSSFWNKGHAKSALAIFEAFIHGVPYTLYQTTQQFGLEELLDNIFPNQQRNGASAVPA